MPAFKTIKEAERYGEKNYFEPVIKENPTGKFIVYDNWDLRNKK